MSVFKLWVSKQQECDTHTYLSPKREVKHPPPPQWGSGWNVVLTSAYEYSSMLAKELPLSLQMLVSVKVGYLPITSWPDAPQAGRNMTVGREQDNTTAPLKNNGGFQSSTPLFLLPHLFLSHPSQSNSWILKWGRHMCLQPDLHEALFYSSQLVAGAKTEGTTNCVWNHLLTQAIKHLHTQN